MRTVGVELIAKVAAFVRGMNQAERATDDVKKSVDDVARSAPAAGRELDATGRQAKGAARNVDDMRDELASLDRQILQTGVALTGLSREFARTGDSGILKSLRVTQRDLRQLSNVRGVIHNAMGDLGRGAGDDTATGFITRFTQRLGSTIANIPKDFTPNFIVAGAALGVAMAPTLGAAVAGAVIGGAAGLGIIGGVVLAARDPRVKTAGADLGQSITGDLQNRAQVFVGPMLSGIAKVRSAWSTLGPDLDRIFASNRFIGPLVDAAIRGSQKIISGVGDLVAAADPVMRSLTGLVDKVSTASSRTLRLLAGDAVQASSAIDDLALGLSNVITVTGGIIHAAAAVHGYLAQVDDVIDSGRYWIENNSYLAKQLKSLGIDLDLTAGSARKVGSGTFGAAQGIDAAAAATRDAGPPARLYTAALVKQESQMADVERAAYGDRDALVSLSHSMQAELNPVMGLIDAQKQFKRVQDAAAAAVRQHGRNSKEARQASLDLAGAAVNLTGKVGALGNTFNGRLTPAMRTTLRSAGLTKNQINDVERAFKTAKTAGDRFAKNYRANTSISNSKPVSDRLWALGQMQAALKSGNVSAARFGYLSKVASGRFSGLAEGGTVPGSSPHKKADNIPAMLTAGEFVQPVDSVQYYGAGFMKAVQKRRIPRDVAAQIAAYAGGGEVGMPFPVNAARTRVPSVKEALAVVAPAVPAGVGGPGTWRTIIKLARALVPGVGVISTVRPGAHTLSGSLSYHALGRAVDFSPSMQLARKWNVTYGRRTLEEITPWRQYDLWHGRAHHYSAALHAQHSGGNAHVHIAMRRGGVIAEPVVGVGASGRTYSFAEHGPERVTPLHYMPGSGGSGGGGTTNVYVQAGYVVTPQQLEDRIAYTVDTLRRKGRI